MRGREEENPQERGAAECRSRREETELEGSNGERVAPGSEDPEGEEGAGPRGTRVKRWPRRARNAGQGSAEE